MAPRRGPRMRYAAAGRGAEVAWEAALSIVLGGLVGIWIDNHTGTSPLFLVVFLALGLTVAVRQLLRFAKTQAAADAKAARPQTPPEEPEPPRDRDLN